MSSNTLIIKGTSDSPFVNFNKESGILLMGGLSLPENVIEFYDPILKWLEKYIEDPNTNTKVEFFFEYLNTASSNVVMRILELITKLENKCKTLEIEWDYLAEDFDMKNTGIEMLDHINLNYELVAKDQFMDH